MKIEDLVLTIEQMQHLKELGLEVKDTAMSWVKKHRDCYGNFKVNASWEVQVNPYFFRILESAEIIPTLTLQEILEMLPDHIVHNNLYYELLTNRNECWIGYKLCSKKEDNRTNLKIYAFMKDEIRAAYNMLCWVAGNGYLKKEEEI